MCSGKLTRLTAPSPSRMFSTLAGKPRGGGRLRRQVHEGLTDRLAIIGELLVRANIAWVFQANWRDGTARSICCIGSPRPIRFTSSQAANPLPVHICRSSSPMLAKASCADLTIPSGGATTCRPMFSSTAPGTRVPSWKPTAAPIRAAGHQVYTPTIKGNRPGDAKTTGLEEAIQSIADYLAENNLKDVILLGHSYGGMVITGVADLAPERIRAPGLLECVRAEQRRDASTTWCRRPMSGCSMPSPPSVAMARWCCRSRSGARPSINDASLELAQKAYDILNPHPLKTFTDKISLKANPAEMQIAKVLYQLHRGHRAAAQLPLASPPVGEARPVPSGAGAGKPRAGASPIPRGLRKPPFLEAGRDSSAPPAHAAKAAANARRGAAPRPAPVDLGDLRQHDRDLLGNDRPAHDIEMPAAEARPRRSRTPTLVARTTGTDGSNWCSSVARSSDCASEPTGPTIREIEPVRRRLASAARADFGGCKADSPRNPSAASISLVAEQAIAVAADEHDDLPRPVAACARPTMPGRKSGLCRFRQPDDRKTASLAAPSCAHSSRRHDRERSRVPSQGQGHCRPAAS